MKRAAELGFSAVGMTDSANLGCAVDFVEQANKAGIKPILGCKIPICGKDATIKDDTNGRPYSNVIILAKNLAGWKQLVRVVSTASSKECKYYGPRIDLDRFADFTQDRNLIAITGYPCSDMANLLFGDDIRTPYFIDNLDLLKRDCVNWTDGSKAMVRLAEKYISIFGAGNVFLAASELHPDSMPAQHALANSMRWVSKRVGVPVVAINDTHYTTINDAEDHRLVLTSGLKQSHRHINKFIEQSRLRDFAGFIISNRYHLPSTEEMAEHHNEDELDQAGEIADMCEKYTILHNPMLPAFDCPNGMNASSYLLELCNSGWKSKIEGVVDDNRLTEYQQRLDMELKVIGDAGLPDYFLIVQDYMNFGRNLGWLLGPGRGCLTAEVPIITGDGSTKPLANVRVGDLVVNRDGKLRPVLNTHEYDVSEDLIKIATM